MYRMVMLSILTVILLGCTDAKEENAELPAQPEGLGNGLTAIVRPVSGTDQAALVVLYDIGSDHDPEGKSGLAHLVEHVYITAAAGKAKARTAQEFMQRYPRGWNAQTGPLYTVIATVFPVTDLEKELEDAAARMKKLNVTQADLDREKPRIADELANMFDRIGHLAAMNRAREKVCPTPRGGRRGGVPEQVAGITLEEVNDRLASYYKPNNAALILAGGFDAAEASKLITRHFGRIPRGPDVPDPGTGPEAKPVVVEEVHVKSHEHGPARVAVTSIRAPRPGHEGYAAFLVIAAKLQEETRIYRSGPGHFPVIYAVLDDPDVLSISVPLEEDETLEHVLKRLGKYLTHPLQFPLEKEDIPAAKNMFGFLLGMAKLPRSALRQNLYGLAFSIGRRRQLGIDPEKLSKALDELTNEQFQEAVRTFVTEGIEATVVVSPEK